MVSGMLIFQQCGQSQKDLLFDVTKLKGKDPEDVSRILKIDPDSTFIRHFVEGQRFIQLYYTADSSEFRYRNGKLIEIIIHKPAMKYSPESIESFGLNYRTPSSVDTSAFIRWYDYPGFDAISFYKVGNRIGNNGSEIFKAYFNYKD